MKTIMKKTGLKVSINPQIQALSRYELYHIGWAWIFLMAVMFIGAMFSLAKMSILHSSFRNLTVLIRDHEFYRDNDYAGTLQSFAAGIRWYLLVALAVLPCMACSSFMEEKNGRAGEFLSVLPFSKNRRIALKLFFGTLVYTVPLCLYGILSALIQLACKGWMDFSNQTFGQADYMTANESFSYLAIGILEAWLILTAVYFLAVLLQVLFTNSYIAVGIQLCCYFLPVYMSNAIFNINAAMNLGWQIPVSSGLFIWEDISILDFVERYDGAADAMANYFVIPDGLEINLCVYVCSSTLLAAAIFLFFRRYQSSMRGQLCWSKGVRTVLLLLFGVLGALLPCSLVFSKSLDMAELLVLMVIGGLFAVLFGKRMMELSGRS